MTLTTYRSPAARALHALIDRGVALCRAWHLYTGHAPRAKALTVLDDAVLRDSNIVCAETWAVGAQTQRG